MKRQQFTQRQTEEFEMAADPHSWFLSAAALHSQAVVLYSRRGCGMLTKLDASDKIVGSWSETNKATFLLCAFALENAIKAFLVYENPAWISGGYLHDELCSHKLVALSKKSTFISNKTRDQWVLAAFEEGNDSWMRYPCSRRASDLKAEPQFQSSLWVAYLGVMRDYGAELARHLKRGWRGLHGFGGSWLIDGECLGASVSNPLPDR
jgi:hypothetical protein